MKCTQMCLPKFKAIIVCSLSNLFESQIKITHLSDVDKFLKIGNLVYCPLVACRSSICDLLPTWKMSHDMEKGGYGEPQPAGYGQPITPPPSYGQPAPSYGKPDTMPVSSQPQHTAITVVQAPQVNKLQHYREHLPKRIH